MSIVNKESLQKLIRLAHFTDVQSQIREASTGSETKKVMRRLSALNYRYSDRHFKLNMKISHRSVPELI